MAGEGEFRSWATAPEEGPQMEHRRITECIVGSKEKVKGPN